MERLIKMMPNGFVSRMTVYLLIVRKAGFLIRKLIKFDVKIEMRAIDLKM